MSPPPAAPNRPTMADIARAAGVHPSTVSLSLRDQPAIPPATRERIRRVADRLGYQPDPLLNAFNSRGTLARARSHDVFAFISDLPGRAALERSERHRELLAGARAQAARTGRRVEVFFTGPGSGQLPPARLGQVLLARGIHALIVAAFAPATGTLALDWAKFCSVAIESPDLAPQLDNLAANHREAARLAVQHLRAAGRRRIAFLLDPSLGDAAWAQLRAGYLVENSLRPALAPLPFFPASDDVACRVRRHHPDALVGCGLPPPSGLPLIKSLAAIGLPSAGSTLPGVPAVHAALGRRAVELLALRRQASQTGLPAHPSTTLLPVAWQA